MDVSKKLSSLQEISKAKLSQILVTDSNTKHLVLEPAIIKPLERVCGVSWLKGNGVEKIFKIGSGPINFKASAIFYIIYPNFLLFQQILNEIRAQIDIDKTVKKKFHVIIVPSIPLCFETELEELGMYSYITLHSFQWMPLYLDNGILSLEVLDIYNQLFVKQDYTLLPCLSQILWELHFVVGKPKFVIAAGNYANMVLTHFNESCEEIKESSKVDCDFGCLILLDRNVDYTSALLTPGTYTALLKEVYNIRSGICEEKGENDQKVDNKCNPIIPKHKVSFNLDSRQDKIYEDIKNRYFTEVTSVLSSLTKQLKTEQDSSKDMCLDEIKQYVKTQLQATKNRKKSITNHLLAAESIVNVLGHKFENLREIEHYILSNINKESNLHYLEEILTTENDKLSSLRLFCLLNVTQRLSDSEIKSFWAKYLQQFGFNLSSVYSNLITAGFIEEEEKVSSKIIKKFTRGNFDSIAKVLKQIPADPDKIDKKFPTCPSYVFGGSYIPLITQIINLILSSVPIEEIRNKLGGLGSLSINNNRGYPLESRSILVYVIGGITYAEIAACNLLETVTSSKIYLLSDSIINGNDIMASLLDI